MRYDGHDRLTRLVYPHPALPDLVNEANYEGYTHDPNGNRTSRRLRDGGMIGYEYDNLNRLTRRDAPNGVDGVSGDYWDFDVSYGYDNLNRRTSAVDYAGPGTDAHWRYDALGRLTAEDGGFGFNDLDYDAAGRLVRFNYTGGGPLAHVDYSYLDTGEMLTVAENGSTAASCAGQASCILATLSYDEIGRRTNLARGNGTNTSYEYDPVSRLSALAHDFAGTAHDVAFGFTRNAREPDHRQ